MPHIVSYFETASRKSLHYPLEDFGNITAHTKSLQKDGTQIPFYVVSEIKKKDYCNLCCRR